MESARSFNYNIANFFIKNIRITILVFLLLVVTALYCTLSLRPSGFPNPSLPIVVIQTTYTGADANTVASTVTSPLEGQLKSLQGIDTFTSTSTAGSSSIIVNAKTNIDVNTIETQINAAISTVTLPTGATKPLVSIPEIKTPDYYISVAGENPAQIFKTEALVKQKLYQLPGTAGISSPNDLTQKVYITVDETKAALYHITDQEIAAGIGQLTGSIPVTNNQAIDGKSVSIETELTGGTSLTDLGNTIITALPTPIKLSSIATILPAYEYASDPGTYLTYSNQTIPSVLLTIRTSPNTDIASYETSMVNILKNIAGSTFYPFDKTITYNPDSTRTLIVENYSVNYENSNQVQEVVSGLLGSPLTKVPNGLNQIGWIFGGIELVFIAMLIFVSWRAAIVSALAIPLSLAFSFIYLTITHNNLNTLVLFSLVLAIGLVVDPALVILESVQRKLDQGLRGKEAALKAIEDVGNGLFMAALTNIIVFIPFAVVSGVIGEIFAYIPLTLIPAVVGSYIVPLIFLSWIGSAFLKRGRNKTESEEDNMWPIARFVIRVNTAILRSKRLVRVGFIAIIFAIPFVIAGYFILSGKLQVTEFSKSPPSRIIELTADFLPSVTNSEKDTITKTVASAIGKDTNVYEVFPITNGLNYYIYLKPNKEEKTNSVVNLAEATLSTYQNQLDNISVAGLGFTPPSSTNPVQVQVTNADSTVIKNGVSAVAAAMNELCFTNKKFSISADCPSSDRPLQTVSDDYTAPQATAIQVILNRNKLITDGLVSQASYISALVNKEIAGTFSSSTDTGSQISLGGMNTEIYIKDSTKTNVTTLTEVKNIPVTSSTGKIYTLNDIATITEVASPAVVTHTGGQTISVVSASPKSKFASETYYAQMINTTVSYFTSSKLATIGLSEGDIASYSQGGTADFAASFQQLLIALMLSIFFTYFALVIFFESFTLPLVIVLTIPLTFIGIFPALTYLGTGQLGFLEIIGIIILVGIVENVAIFMIDAARQKIRKEGWNEKKAIAYASGVRLRPVLLTKITAVASLAPLVVANTEYKSLALVIIFGLITSGFTSLFTTPVLFIFFRWASRKFNKARWYSKFFWIVLFPIAAMVSAIREGKQLGEED